MIGAGAGVFFGKAADKTSKFISLCWCRDFHATCEPCMHRRFTCDRTAGELELLGEVVHALGQASDAEPGVRLQLSCDRRMADQQLPLLLLENLAEL